MPLQDSKHVIGRKGLTCPNCRKPLYWDSVIGFWYCGNNECEMYGIPWRSGK